MTTLRPLDPFREFLDKFFEEDFFPVFSWASRSIPPVDLYEDEKNIYVELEVPGFKKENIKVSYEDGYLKIEGNLKEEAEQKKSNYWKKESRRRSFVKVIPIPYEIEIDKASAELKEGILKIVLPKVSPSKSSGKEIKVE